MFKSTVQHLRDGVNFYAIVDWWYADSFAKVTTERYSWLVTGVWSIYKWRRKIFYRRCLKSMLPCFLSITWIEKVIKFLLSCCRWSLVKTNQPICCAHLRKLPKYFKFIAKHTQAVYRIVDIFLLGLHLNLCSWGLFLCTLKSMVLLLNLIKII